MDPETNASVEVKPKSEMAKLRPWLMALGVMLVILVILALLGGFSNNSTEQAQFTEVDLRTSQGLDRLPEGFPQDIPVDLNTMTYGVSENIGDGLLQSELHYLSNKDINGLVATYKSYIVARQYKITTETVDEQVGIASMQADSPEGNIFSVSFVPDGDLVKVAIAFISPKN